MLTFHRPNADLTLEVIPDDLLENKSLRKRERQRKGERERDANIHTNARASQKSVSPDYSPRCASKGREKVKYATNWGRCAASSGAACR